MTMTIFLSVTGLIPMLSRGTLVMVPLVDNLENKSWEAKIIEQKDTKIKLVMNTPPTAPIGRYQLRVITWSPEGSNTFGPKPENDIFLLFNPWCKGMPGQKYGGSTSFMYSGVTAAFLPVSHLQVTLCLWIMRTKGTSMF